MQGEVLIYGTHSELIGRGVDTTQLLGLIKEGDEKKEEEDFSYEDNDVEDQDGETANQQHKGMCVLLSLSLSVSLSSSDIFTCLCSADHSSVTIKELYLSSV